MPHHPPLSRHRCRSRNTSGGDRDQRPPVFPGIVTLCLCLCLCLSTPQAQAEPAGADAPVTRDLLTFIRALEAPGGYDDYERRIPIAPPAPLSEMSVGAVMDWQTRVRRAGAPSTAAGGYQIISTTLSRLVREYAIPRDARFDAGLQDRLARLLISECGARPDASARAAHPRFGNCLAGIWAALPLTRGQNRGLSAHHGVAGNRALTTPKTVLALLAGEAVALRPSPGPDPHRAQLRRAFQGRPLAFGAVGVDYNDVNSAMREVSGTGRLTPSVRNWEFDPYASQ